jgi:hypothetical protein
MAASSGAQVPAGEGEEHVLQVGVVGAEVVRGDPADGQARGHLDGQGAVADDLDGVATAGDPRDPGEVGPRMGG